MHHALHNVVKRMGGQTSKARGARGVRGVHTFLIAKNAPETPKSPQPNSGTKSTYSTWIALTNQPIAEKSVATISDQREYYTSTP